MSSLSIEERAVAARSMVLLAGIAVLGGCKGAPPPQAPPPSEVSVLAVQAQTVEDKTEYVGQVEPVKRVEVRAPVSGIITARPFEEGGVVHKGDVLYRIDQTTYLASYNSALAQEADAKARYDNGQRNFERNQALIAAHAVAQKDLDDAQTEVARARAAWDQAKAGVASAKKNLDDTTVRAEIDGRVGKALLVLGARVNSSQDLLTTIDQLDPAYVTFRPAVQQLIRWKRDPRTNKLLQQDGALKVAIAFADGTTIPRTGKIQFVSPVLDSATGTQQYRALFQNADRLLVPGQFVRVRLLGLTRDSALVVPQRAIQQQLGRKFVYVVDAKSAAATKEVVVGSFQGDMVVVDSGLVAGDRVVIDGVQKIGPGAPVKAEPYVPGAPAPDAANDKGTKP